MGNYHEFRLDKTAIDPFAVRFVDPTLSQACLYLDRQVQAREEHIQRYSGGSLQLYSCEKLQLVTHWRCLLGPSRTTVLEMTHSAPDSIGPEQMTPVGFQ